MGNSMSNHHAQISHYKLHMFRELEVQIFAHRESLSMELIPRGIISVLGHQHPQRHGLCVLPIQYCIVVAFLANPKLHRSTCSLIFTSILGLVYGPKCLEISCEILLRGMTGEAKGRQFFCFGSMHLANHLTNFP